MQRQILVPLDGSKLAEQALPHAAAMARAIGSGLTLIWVVTPPPGVNPLVWAVPIESTTWTYHKKMLGIAQEYLASIAGRLEADGTTVQTRMVEGEAAEQIILHAQQSTQTSMIVMATHGRSGLSRWLLGSVAEKILHAAPTPLVLIRPAADDAEMEVSLSVADLPAYRTILVPLDGSLLAEQALEQAQPLAAATGASLLLLSVANAVGDLIVARRAETMRRIEVLNERERKRLAAYLADVALDIEDAGITVRTRLSEGDPAEEILRAGREAGADLIVMATHGRSGLKRLWLGSVAMKVTHTAELPVLLVGVRVPAAEAAEKKVEASSEVQRQQLADQTNEGTIWPGAQNNRSQPEPVAERRGKAIGSRTY
ncbi:MAG: universal stress protein [Chloroflexi bacterium]|nr:universal stress protein [Chloroflexota bacterium]